MYGSGCLSGRIRRRSFRPGFPSDHSARIFPKDYTIIALFSSYYKIESFDPPFSLCILYNPQPKFVPRLNRLRPGCRIRVLFSASVCASVLRKNPKKTTACCADGCQRVKKVFLPRCVRFPNFWKKFGKRFDWTRKETLTVSLRAKCRLRRLRSGAPLRRCLSHFPSLRLRSLPSFLTVSRGRKRGPAILFIPSDTRRTGKRLGVACFPVLLLVDIS